MSTPLQRARTKLRVMYRLQQAAREHNDTIEEGHEPGSPVVNGAEADHALVRNKTHEMVGIPSSQQTDNTQKCHSPVNAPHQLFSDLHSQVNSTCSHVLS